MGKKQQSQVETVQVNLIGSTRDTRVTLDQEVNKLWDLEGLGIRDSQDEVYEGFKENTSSNGVRYSVKLPWKEGHSDVPSNHSTSLRRYIVADK